MSTALYRRYRPETFADVIGQEHVTEPLTQALRSDRVNHAYLFSGPRGCGKTTSARILARCLNCEQGPTAEPCGECDSCVALARGGTGTVDVVEIDAASHGGVDDARDLRERAAFGPAQSRYKVYIIDEAHMVTTHGFNALLKVVEEPPEHVKFIFATTEPEKVLSTIRSRTHHYPFHLVPPQRLSAYLEQVCATEGVDVAPGVLSFVTRAGGGSVRDSMSVLDQLMSGADEAGLSYERTASLLGFTDAELLDAVVEAVANRDAASVFTEVDKVMESGHDPRRFVEDLLDRYRDLIVLSAVGERSGGLLTGVPQEAIERMRQQAASYGAGALTRCADIVSHGLAEMTGAVSYRLLLELVCARLLLPGASGEQGYAARLDRVERRLSAAQPAARPEASAPVTRSRRTPTQAAAGTAATTPQQQQTPGHQTPEQQMPEQPRENQPAAIADQPPAQQAPGGMDTDAMRRSWPEVLDKVKTIRRVTWSFVSVNTQIVDFDGHRLLLQIGTAGQAETFRKGNHAEVVRQALIEAIGVDTRVDSVVAGADGEPEPRRPRTRAQTPVEPESHPVQASAARPSTAREESAVGQDPPASASWSQSTRTKPPAWAAGTDHVPAKKEDVPAKDDDNLENSTTVGQPVIESVLGGTVISIDDDSQR